MTPLTSGSMRPRRSRPRNSVKRRLVPDDDQAMNTSRCSVPGSTCRLLQLELPDPRPVWAALDAAGARHFTGELTLHFDPVVRVWFLGGEVYLAERDGDAPLAQRLVSAGVVTMDDLAAGVVRAADIEHLGRLFDRVPRLDRDTIELTVELATATLLGEIADQVVPSLETGSYRHHPSGVHRWWQRGAIESTRATVAPSAISNSVIDEVAALAARAAELPTLRVRSVPVAEPVPPARHADDLFAMTFDLTEASVVEYSVVEYSALENDVVENHLAVDDAITIEDVATIEEPTIEEPTIVMVESDQATVEAAVEATVHDVVDAAPSPGAVDLTRIIEQVAAEESFGGPTADEPSDISDEVRAAVRQALAEITAATRPSLTDGLSVAALLATSELPIEPEHHPADDPAADDSFSGLRISLPR